MVNALFFMMHVLSCSCFRFYYYSTFRRGNNYKPDDTDKMPVVLMSPERIAKEKVIRYIFMKRDEYRV